MLRHIFLALTISLFAVIGSGYWIIGFLNGGYIDSDQLVTFAISIVLGFLLSLLFIRKIVSSKTE